MIDGIGRSITYLRMSVTDRCNLRCTYCMPARMRFAPRADILSLEELEIVAAAFVDLGVRKLRLTGGEPLVRKGFVDLFTRLTTHLHSGALDELTFTTNGIHLSECVGELAAAGLRRVNVSLDTLRPENYMRISRGGCLDQVLVGIEAAKSAGVRVKINTVALADENLDELVDIAAWALSQDCDFTVIEVMPLGAIDGDRRAQFVPMSEVRRRFERRWVLHDIERSTGGPARYTRTADGGIIGFISPLTHNFCSSCNRVRLTATGTLYPCLGNSHATDLKPALGTGKVADLKDAILRAINLKPPSHYFLETQLGQLPMLERTMSATGG